MKYTFKIIYENFGQYDKVVVVGFLEGTISFDKFGEWITGEFLYTRREREELEIKLKDSNQSSTIAFQKFNILLDYNIEQKIDLKKNGFDIQHIKSIYSHASNEKDYNKKGIRKLRDPIVVKFDPSQNTPEEWENITLNLYSAMQLNGGILTPFEKIENNAIIAHRFFDKIPKEHRHEVIDLETGKLKDEIRLSYLSRKFEAGNLDKLEMAEFEELVKKESERKAAILSKELKRSTEDVKNLEKNYPGIINRLILLSTSFRPKRYSYGKFPVWIDYERFIHIYIFHVTETQIGERSKPKGRFKYEIQDVERLIEIVITNIDKEIQKHFEVKPNKDFKRHGKMAIYYKGDYYAIHINPKGRIMTFYRVGPNETYLS